MDLTIFFSYLKKYILRRISLSEDLWLLPQMGLTRTIERPELFHMHILSTLAEISPWPHQTGLR